jgi:hypothetical protein
MPLGNGNLVMDVRIAIKKDKPKPKALLKPLIYGTKR